MTKLTVVLKVSFDLRKQCGVRTKNTKCLTRSFTYLCSFNSPTRINSI